MPHYLVLKRTIHDWVSLPGEILTGLNLREAGILLDRGFIIPVPSDYPGRISAPPPVIEAKVLVVPKAEAVVTVVTEKPSADRDKDLRELMAKNRSKLNELAVGVGIEAPDVFATKREVAEAILSKISDGGAGS